ncbi:MAG: DNA adenine methylase [Actinomycetota bacterium]
MKPPIRYYGGKAKLAPWLAQLMPELPVYVEVFAGSAAVLMARRRVRHEVINDADGNVVSFFRALRDHPDELIEALRLTPYARDEFKAAQAACSASATSPATNDDIERARQFFVVTMQSFAATTAPATGWSWSTKNNVDRPRSVQNYVTRLAAVAERLRFVHVENIDAADLIERHAAQPEVLMYLDPPYLDETRTNPGSTGHGYAIDTKRPDDHRRWADLLRDAEATAIVSGYPSPLYDEDLYAGWHRVERAWRTDLGHRGERTEVLWSNRPIAVQHQEVLAL